MPKFKKLFSLWAAWNRLERSAIDHQFDSLSAKQETVFLAQVNSYPSPCDIGTYFKLLVGGTFCLKGDGMHPIKMPEETQLFECGVLEIPTPSAPTVVGKATEITCLLDASDPSNICNVDVYAVTGTPLPITANQSAALTCLGESIIKAPSKTIVTLYSMAIPIILCCLSGLKYLEYKFKKANAARLQEIEVGESQRDTLLRTYIGDATITTLEYLLPENKDDATWVRYRARQTTRIEEIRTLQNTVRSESGLLRCPDWCGIFHNMLQFLRRSEYEPIRDMDMEEVVEEENVLRP